jgi:HK97 gp10 family phage protein
MAKKAVELLGAKEIDEVLRNLPAKMSKAVLQKANREAAQPLLEEMQRLVPQEEGDLYDSLGSVAMKASKEVALLVGPRNKPRNKYVGWRGHFLEFGTSHHSAQPYIRPAFDRKIGEVRQLMKIKLAEVLTKYIKRTVKKNLGGLLG